MSSVQHGSVTEFQANRASGAPRRWTYWVALFTAVNGFLLLSGQDLTFLAGLVAPFAFAGATSHFVAAALFAAIAYASLRYRPILLAALVLYLADTAFAAYSTLWSGVIMHVVVLALVGIAVTAGRRLKAQLAAETGGNKV